MNNQKQILNIVPIKIHSNNISVGKIPKLENEEYQILREKYWNSHVFRFDNRTNEIFNIPLHAEISPIGEKITVSVQEHLSLIAKAIQHSLLLWLADKRPILYKSNKKLIFLGQTHDTLLFSKALDKANKEKTDGLEIVLKYEIDCRVFDTKNETPFLGLVIDLSTSNIIDIPIAELHKKGLSIQDRYVCTKKYFPQDFLEPKLEIAGSVSSIKNSQAFLLDVQGESTFDTKDLYLEPRWENFKDVVKLYYGSDSQNILNLLENLLNPIRTANGKLNRIKTTLAGFKKKEISFSNNVKIEFGELLDSLNSNFPELITTERPTFLFGPQGRKRGPFPDSGITTHGPYMYMQHERNEPTIGVLCESRYRGRVEQFVHMFLEGFPNEDWSNTNRQNPYREGLISKYRLSKVRLEYEEINSPANALEYENAAKRLLNRLHFTPDLVIVQIRESHKNLFGEDNPYFVSKAFFMQAGAPTQSIQISKMELPADSLAYLLNNLSLAVYSKLDGIPWVIATRRPTTHEIVIGLGSTTITEKRLGEKSRHVGITSIFQGDGRYLVWGATREVEFENYSQALLDSLLAIVLHVKERNAWQEGDKVRIICHVFKRLKNVEIGVIKKLVAELVDDKFHVEFAFLDISWHHPYHIFAPEEKGKRYWDREARKNLVKGKGVPSRGFSILLGKNKGLIHLAGPNELKTSFQGLPKPLLVELHPDSDFVDMTYLIRQIFHFSFMSWRSFFPSTEPITITYSKLIARLLGNLKTIKNWNSQVITVGSLRDRKWFL